MNQDQRNALRKEMKAPDSLPSGGQMAHYIKSLENHILTLREGTMTFYQHKAANAAQYEGHGTIDGLPYTFLGAMNELGEAAGKLKKTTVRGMRGDKPVTEDVREAIAHELGDTLWYITMSAHNIGFDLNRIAQMNIAKLEGRLTRNAIKGDGDNR